MPLHSTYRSIFLMTYVSLFWEILSINLSLEDRQMQRWTLNRVNDSLMNIWKLKIQMSSWKIVTFEILSHLFQQCCQYSKHFNSFRRSSYTNKKVIFIYFISQQNTDQCHPDWSEILFDKLSFWIMMMMTATIY